MADVRKCAISKVDLKKFRQMSGLSLRRLEVLTGIHFSILGRYERGVLIMSWEKWERIKKVLDEAYEQKRNKNTSHS